MKLKNFALRGLIALAITVAVCMFFSRTVQSITTPKVQVITAEKGRFEEKLSYTAQVYFAETETLSAENPHGMAVTQTHVQPGNAVQAGDVIFTLHLPGYEEQMAALQAEYSALSIQLVELDADHCGLPREAPHRHLYDDMSTANAALNEAVYAARLTAMAGGMSLPADVSAWEESAIPAAVRTAMNAYDEACAAYHAYITANPGSEAIFAYANARDALLADMDAVMSQMLALDMAMAQPRTVTAPRGGYIVAVDAANLSFTMNAEDCAPVLRCLAPGRTVAEGTRADVITDLYGTERSTVVGMAGSFLDVALPEDMAAALPALMETGVQLSITHRAKQATTLLPSSALRSSGEDAYVYQIEYTYGGILSTRSMKVVKVPVTIIEQNSKTASIAEDLEGEELAVREDRLLTDGQTVMRYVN